MCCRVTKTGKPKFYCSKKPGENPVEQLPPGYELREDPERALVTVRKVRPSAILPAERELVERLAAELSAARCIVDVDGRDVIVYACDNDGKAFVDSLLQDGMLRTGRTAALDLMASIAHYSPMLRFRLDDEKERLYSAERWCFLGGVDDWFPLNYGQLDRLLL